MKLLPISSVAGGLELWACQVCYVGGSGGDEQLSAHLATRTHREAERERYVSDVRKAKAALSRYDASEGRS